MPRESQEKLSNEESDRLLTLLENIGKNKWLNRWITHMAIPQSLDVFSTKKRR